MHKRFLYVRHTAKVEAKVNLLDLKVDKTKLVGVDQIRKDEEVVHICLRIHAHGGSVQFMDGKRCLAATVGILPVTDVGRASHTLAAHDITSYDATLYRAVLCTRLALGPTVAPSLQTSPGYNLSHTCTMYYTVRVLQCIDRGFLSLMLGYAYVYCTI